MTWISTTFPNAYVSLISSRGRKNAPCCVCGYWIESDELASDFLENPGPAHSLCLFGIRTAGVRSSRVSSIVPNDSVGPR